MTLIAIWQSFFCACVDQLTECDNDTRALECQFKGNFSKKQFLIVHPAYKNSHMILFA